MSEFTYSHWRHGGWYVNNVRYPSGAVGCVTNNMVDPATGKADRKWRIACDERLEDHTYPTRDAAAAAERDLIAAMSRVREPVGGPEPLFTPAPEQQPGQTYLDL